MTKDDDKKHGLSSEDADLWSYATRNDERLEGRIIHEPVKPAKSGKKSPTITTKLPPTPPYSKTENNTLEAGSSVGIDKYTADSLRKGKLPIEARLDLHGHTQEQAQAALGRFITSSHANGKRCVLVITGRGKKGDFTNKGILRQRLPEWLNTPDIRELCLSFRQANISHGGEGAFYVLLKKKPL